MATYGIDLGTTYSCIASIDDTGRPAIVKNAVGNDTTPSVVYFETPDHVVVGQDAKEQAKVFPELVASLVKRQMGEDVEFTFHGQKHSPQSISALILKELARAATEQTGEPVRDVVITVPAYFGVAERKATKDAGEIAGLNVLDLVPEPVAAALHYEAVTAGADRDILVYDLGGGTFDTTVIRLRGEEVSVVCTDGDHHLGGADWDDKIADYLLERYVAENPDSTAGESEEALQELATAAEDMKKQLSSTQSRRKNLRFDGKPVQVELTREQAEQLTSDLLERTLDITERTIATAKGLGVERFDDVLLVGGATRMPVVSARLREKFGFEPRVHDPDLAVAKGAAQFALIASVKVSLPEAAAEAGGAPAAISQEKVEEVADQLGISTAKVRELAEKKISTVVPRAFGVKLIDSNDPELKRLIVEHLLSANTPLPSEPITQRFGTAFPDQTGIQIEIMEQAGAKASPELADNNDIADGVISGLPPLPQGSPIDVTFAMDASGTLSVHAVELTTKKDLHIEVRVKGLDQADVAEARTAVARYSLSE